MSRKGTKKNVYAQVKHEKYLVWIDNLSHIPFNTEVNLARQLFFLLKIAYSFFDKYVTRLFCVL